MKIAEAVETVQQISKNSTLTWSSLMATELRNLAAQEPEPVEERWKPSKGEPYWTLEIYAGKWKPRLYNFNSQFDEGNFDSGLCYQTKAEAEARADELRKLTNLK